MAVWLQRPVSYVWRETGSVLPGETAGHARIPTHGKIGPSQLAIALVGYMSVDASDWPPLWPQALDEELEALGTVLLRLGATQQQYEGTIELCRRLLVDEDFIALRNSIARALEFCPHLDAQAIEDLSRRYLPQQGATP